MIKLPILMVVLPLFSVAMVSECAAQEGAAKEQRAARIASLSMSESKVTAMIDRIIEVVMKHPEATQMGAAQKREFKTLAKAMQTNLAGMLPWDKLRAAMAAELGQRFTSEELGEILAFYEKGAGKKLLDLQPDLLMGMADRMAKNLTELKIATLAARNLTQLENKLERKAKQAISEAKAAEPFPAEMLLGRWNGSDDSDPEFRSYWWHEKKADGSNVVGGIDIDSNEKTFTKYEDPGRFVVIGRLLIETDLKDSEFSTYFIIKSVTKEKLVYLLVDEELPVDKWEVSVDQREAITPPKIPAGYSASTLEE